jgi:tryptophan synthase alpha subunit
MADKYGILRAELIVIYDQIINPSFEQARIQMLEFGCPFTAYLDLYYDGDQIRRQSDNARVNDLSPKERFNLYPHLDQLFKLAINNKLTG